jgi:hypothetical protein
MRLKTHVVCGLVADRQSKVVERGVVTLRRYPPLPAVVPSTHTEAAPTKHCTQANALMSFEMLQPVE